MLHAQFTIKYVVSYRIVSFLSVNLHAQQNTDFIISVDVHVARSAGWRKKFTKFTN